MQRIYTSAIATSLESSEPFVRWKARVGNWPCSITDRGTVKMKNLKGQVALVTGASPGVGRGVAPGLLPHQFGLRFHAPISSGANVE